MLLNDVKLALRIKSDVFDEGEILPLIDACKLDLKRAGASSVEETNPLVKQAIVLYCKAYFGKDSEAERFRKCYEMIRDGIALMGDDMNA